MANRRTRFLAATVAVVAIGLAGVHIYYPLPYLYRVLVYQDSDFSDIHRFPSQTKCHPLSCRLLVTRANAAR